MMIEKKLRKNENAYQYSHYDNYECSIANLLPVSAMLANIREASSALALCLSYGVHLIWQNLDL